MDARFVKWVESPTHWCNIYGAGDLNTVKLACQEFCLAGGLCVTVTPSTYIYCGGLEEGYCVRLINYPKYPTTHEKLIAVAKRLGITILNKTFQHSVLVQTSSSTFWYTKRDHK